MDIVQPDAGVYFRLNDFWSHTLPVRRIDQEHQGDVLPKVVEEGLPPPELEREGGARQSSRNVSPLASCSSIRTDRVCHLPEDQSFHLLSPRSRTRAQQLNLAPHQEFMRSAIARSLVPPSSSPTPS